MNFASLIFILGFLPVALCIYHLAPGLRTRNAVLTVLSYVFYAWWRVDFVVLMLISTLVDHQCATRIERQSEPSCRRRWLLVSLVTNLGLLGWFKYADFGVQTLQGLGVGPDTWTEIILPVGISFYTFQSMSYTIDVYRRQVAPARSLVDFACYVSMFPQLVAGPIVRYRDVHEQLVARTHRLRDFAAGLYLFQFGLVKKVLIADHVAWIADPVFANPEPGLLAAWSGVFAYALQIYFDFSGYSNMAVGLGLMLGFRLPKNFDSPYVARSITEFWRRWHISLSTWLRDYLYVPLGGNRAGRTRTYINLGLTMLLGGLWHGAAWTFVLWGAWQGLFLVVERALGKRAPWHALPPPLQVACTFVIVLCGWAIFRADNLHALGEIASGLAFTNGLGCWPEPSNQAPVAWCALAIGTVAAFTGPHPWTIVRRMRPETVLLFGCLFVTALATLAVRSHTPFLYFRF